MSFTSSMVVPLLYVLICVIFIPRIVLSETFTQVHLPPRAVGFESFAFPSDSSNGHFSVGVLDGRIVKYHGLGNSSWEVFGVASRTWSKKNCVENNDINSGYICRKPFGSGYAPSNEILYIADGTQGLLSIDSTGGVATPLVSSAEGQRFVYTNGLDVDPHTGIVYFTDLSGVFDYRNFSKIIRTHDSTGRLLKYDPLTKEVIVLKRNLSAPAGVAVSSDGSFLVFSEIAANRIQKFWLTGPKTNTSEIIVSSISSLSAPFQAQIT